MTEIKRLNYFDAQFLHVNDFNDEQAYHLAMRRRHNQHLHSWGVAGGGLQVKQKGDKALEVTAGLAIDKDGQEIVLLDPPRPIPLDSAATPNATLYLTARYDDPETDEDPSTKKFTRRTEKPIILLNRDAPKPDDSVILLATVKLNASGNIESVDNGVRTPAGPAPGADISARSLRLGDSLTVSGDATLQKSLTVAGSVTAASLTVTGDATVSGSVTAEGLTVNGNEWLEFGAGIDGKHADAGTIGYQLWPPKDALDIVGAGTTDDNYKIRFWAGGGATFIGNVGISKGLTVSGDATLQKSLTVAGSVTAALLTVTGDATLQKSLTVSGPVKIQANNTLEFGAGVSGKQVDAGKIGYQAFTPNDALGIVGAGTADANRKICFYAEGGATLYGSLTVTGNATLRQEDWKVIGEDGAPAFQNGWVNYGIVKDYNTAGYFRDSLGIVHLRGLVTISRSANGNTIIFTMPEKYRPESREIYIVCSSNLGGKYDFGRVDIDADGYVQVVAQSICWGNGLIKLPVTDDVWVSLDGIAFRAG